MVFVVTVITTLLLLLQLSITVKLLMSGNGTSLTHDTVVPVGPDKTTGGMVSMIQGMVLVAMTVVLGPVPVAITVLISLVALTWQLTVIALPGRRVPRLVLQPG